MRIDDCQPKSRSPSASKVIGLSLNSLSLIESKIVAYTEILVQNVEVNSVEFTVYWNLTHKRKRFIFKFQENHPPTQENSSLQSKQLYKFTEFVQKFPIRKIYMDSKNYSILQPLPLAQTKLIKQRQQSETFISKGNNLLRIQEAGECLSLAIQKIKFTEIVLLKEFELNESKLNWIFNHLQAGTLNLQHQITEAQANHCLQIRDFYLKPFLKSQGQIGNYSKILINLKEFNEKPMIRLIESWIDKIYSFDNFDEISENEVSLISIPKIKIVDPIPYRNEMLIFQVNFEAVVSLSKVAGFGCMIVVKKHEVHELFLMKLIESILCSKVFITVEIECMVAIGVVIDVMTLVFKKYWKHEKYLIKIGNQVEMTSFRLVLNTTGMAAQQIKQILGLMRQPGHYQFICYSNIQFFNDIFELFKEKPLIKFNLFLPLDELQLNYHQLIRKMENHCQNMRVKVLTYTQMLKSIGKTGYLCLNSIFYVLVDRNQSPDYF